MVEGAHAANPKWFAMQSVNLIKINLFNGAIGYELQATGVANCITWPDSKAI